LSKQIKIKRTKVLIENTNESAILISEVKTYKNNGKQFCKLYQSKENYQILKRLSLYEFQILVYIQQHLNINRKGIALSYDLFKNDFSKPSYYRAITGLIEWDIISKGNSNNYYYINTDFLFNGKI